MRIEGPVSLARCLGISGEGSGGPDKSLPFSGWGKATCTGLERLAASSALWQGQWSGTGEWMGCGLMLAAGCSQPQVASPTAVHSFICPTTVRPVSDTETWQESEPSPGLEKITDVYTPCMVRPGSPKGPGLSHELRDGREGQMT